MQTQQKQIIYTIISAILSQIFACQWSFAALPTGPSNETKTLDTSASTPLVRLLRSESQAIELAFSVEDFQVQDVQIDGSWFQRLSLTEAGYTSQVGAPELPVHGALLAIPQKPRRT